MDTKKPLIFLLAMSPVFNGCSMMQEQPSIAFIEVTSPDRYVTHSKAILNEDDTMEQCKNIGETRGVNGNIAKVECDNNDYFTIRTFTCNNGCSYK